ncbi:bZIP transcription factor [Aspergillus saccharolyticus JOP 1030-1]|uniref:BZIP transcription factor n=1 Tax=Aspergillus saccharolyticus JOP 1030-1 TaxID=1450539 RepID=A0A318ZN37_9EURO|nr:hypothetical protein BP01DRAFT_379582 [Aspergillus saccharolyticus JOP 1030-1]PYH48387.1 hypothetical protein BP01DRAFT_379582 [Aspergillus saccharolyticus JOP 1030-1]
MATRLPPLNNVARSPAVEETSPSSTSSLVPGHPVTSIAATFDSSSVVKVEDSPTPSALASADAETPVPDAGGAATAVAGRKRKLNSNSARGVANLTPEQLAKKRANDRQAQRAIRERTKAHIDLLEQQVRDLSSQKPYLDLQAALKQNEAVQMENRELKHGLKTVLEIIQPLLRDQANPDLLASAAAPASTKPTPSISVTSCFSDNSHHPSITRPSVSAGSSYAKPASTQPSAPSNLTFSPAAARRDITAAGSASFRIAFDYQRHNLAHGLDFGGTDERMGFNFLLDTSQQVPKVEGFRRCSEATRPPPPTNTASTYPAPLPAGATTEQSLSLPAHLTPIRNIAPTCTLDAILMDFLHHRQQETAKGVPKQNLVGPSYPSVSSLLNPERSVYSHPLSKVFTDILRTFPDIATLPEQVCVLLSMFLLMRWQIYPTRENYERLPEWLTPRPSQLLTPHPVWIDYLPWPRMRDRLVMSYQDYPFENWFIPFTRTLSVNWPYEATDCLLSTGDGDDLIINPVFERHMRNLSNWSLGPAFAEAYPSLIDTVKIK